MLGSVTEPEVDQHLRRSGLVSRAYPAALASAQEGRFYRFCSDRALLGVMAGVLASYVFEGPMRWLLNMIGLELLVYLRDLLQALLVGLVAASWLAGQASATPLMAVLAVLLVHFSIGCLQLHGAYQSALGLKTFLTFLSGVALAPLIPPRIAGLTRAATLVFWLTALGVVANSVLEFPWIGLTYETALGSAEAAKQWHAGGNVRLPGFSRASFAAAMLVLISMVPLLGARSSAWKRALVLLVAVVTILLTTTKGALTGVTAVVVASSLTLGASHSRLSNSFLAALGMICLALPLVSVELGPAHGEWPSFLSSFRERIEEMWPRAFDLLDTPGKLLWGRGLGGIGTAQLHTDDWMRVNAADNLFVYLLVTFGALGVLYGYAVLSAVLRYLSGRLLRDPLSECVRGWTAIWLAYGLTTNMVEDAAMNTVMGIVLGLSCNQQRPLSKITDLPAAHPHSQRA